MTSMSYEAFLAQQKKGLTFEDVYVPPEMAPDDAEPWWAWGDLAKHEGGGHDQKTHGNWARASTIHDADGSPAALTVNGVTFTRKESVDGRVYWASEDTPLGNVAIWAEEPDAEQLERSAGRYLDYVAEPERRAQNVMMASEMLGRVSIDSIGKVIPLSTAQTLIDIERNLNVWERDSMGRNSEEANAAHLADAVSNLKRSIEPGTLAMRLDEEALESIVAGRWGAEGEILNQHIVGESRGFFDPARREDVELLQGVPRDINDFERPKYGYLEGAEHWSEKVSQYGDITLRFKDQIADRTTVTFGDSLNDDLHGVRMSDLLAGSASPERVVAAMDNRAIRPFWTGDHSRWRGEVPYVELQFHGELSLADVREVGFDVEYEPHDAGQFNYMIERLAERGIPSTIKVHESTGYESRVVVGFDADGDGWIFEGTDKERRG